MIASTETYGIAGDKIDFFFDDGTKIETIMADTKDPSDPGINKWGHDNGRNVLEFEAQCSYYLKYGGNPGNWFSEITGKRVASATNLGSILND